MLEEDDLDRLILVRHGRAIVGLQRDELLPIGEQQIRELAEDIKGIVGDDYYYIFTSPTSRTTKTGDVIDRTLNYPFYGHYIEKEGLRGPPHPANLEKILLSIKEHPFKSKKLPGGIKFRGAILVSHHTIIPPLARFLGLRYGFDVPIPIQEIEEGHAIYMDLTNKTYAMLPRG